MSETIDRRGFLEVAASTGLALGGSVQAARSEAPDANDTVIVGVMGMGGRGTALAQEFQKQPGVEVAYVCDVDRRRAAKAAEVVGKIDGKAPKAATDFRNILDDQAVDALVVATCNHWHAPATILGCTAGKHVYVEKPCSHNPREGELMIAAARKRDRRVQMGVQRRTRPTFVEAVARLREGAIGRLYYARCDYASRRPSIGYGKPAAVPEWLDFDLWQGPAPRRPFRDNILHYNWHWFWHWGNGELGNNGVHTLDLCRWGLGVDYPIHATSGGGRYRWRDDQETPDTHVVTYDFEGDKSITWQGLSCSRHKAGKATPLAVFHGEEGTMEMFDSGYALFDAKDKETQRVTGRSGQIDHVENFLGAIRGGEKLKAEIEEGHKSTLLCHLGNIAQRTGRSLHCDPANGHVVDDADAMTHWSREYEKDWEPQV